MEHQMERPKNKLIILYNYQKTKQGKKKEI